MFYMERQNEILQWLQQRKSMTVRELAKLLFTSESTVRRDLNELERSGKVRRTFGGVVLEETLNREVPLLLRRSQNHEAKQEIAKRAAALVANDQVIFLDASSTVAHLVPHLGKFSNLTVITNSPNTALELGNLGIRTYCTGGLLLDASQAFVGAEAEDFVRRFNADLMFFSSRGVDEAGNITDSSAEESHLRRVMMANARKKYYLYDLSKAGKKYMYTLCTAKEVDGSICEEDASCDRSVKSGKADSE